MESVGPSLPQALQAYTQAWGLDPTLVMGTGFQLLRNEGNVPLQWVHRDYQADKFPTKDDCIAAKRIQQDRIARRSGLVKKEEDEVVEISDRGRR